MLTPERTAVSDLPECWPALALESWKDTCATLHRAGGAPFGLKGARSGETAVVFVPQAPELAEGYHLQVGPGESVPQFLRTASSMRTRDILTLQPEG
jgi:hypothetical protein